MDRRALPVGEFAVSCHFYPCLSSAVGGKGKLAPLLLLSPTPFACRSAKAPSAGAKRGQKYVCSVMEEQSSTWSRQSCTEAPSCSLHSRTLPATTRPQQLHQCLPSVLPGHCPTMIGLSVLRPGPSCCITSHLHFHCGPQPPPC